jgi:hypothetical protein
MSYLLNKRLQIIAWNSLHVKVKGSLSTDRVLIKRGAYTINRKCDLELFEKADGDTIFFEGGVKKKLETDYGENDFLITYDDKYYFQFRHFIFNRRNKHCYNFLFYKQGDSIFVKANISGNDKMQFVRPMHLVKDAKYFRCNVSIDTTEFLYSGVELKSPKCFESCPANHWQVHWQLFPVVIRTSPASPKVHSKQEGLK